MNNEDKQALSGYLSRAVKICVDPVAAIRNLKKKFSVKETFPQSYKFEICLLDTEYNKAVIYITKDGYWEGKGDSDKITNKFEIFSRNGKQIRLERGVYITAQLPGTNFYIPLMSV